MRLLVTALFLLIAPQAIAASFDELEMHLKAGEYDLAKAQIKALYKDRSVITTTKVKQLRDLERLTELLRKADQFQSAADKYLSNPNRDSFSSIEYKFSDLASASRRQNSFIASKEVIDLLNGKMLSANQKIAEVRNLKRDIEAKEEDRRIAERVAKEQKRAQGVAARKAEVERLEKERKEKEAAEKQRIEERRLAVENKAKAAGYKGLFDRGIARFLYKVKHGGSLKDGLGYVFWSDLSDRERNLDNKFEATQLIDGKIIYSLLEYARNETIEFTIMTPDTSGGMFLEGQRLRHSCYTYIGNRQVTTVLGVERTIPIFEPVSDQICK